MPEPPTKQVWTIYVCPECGAIYGAGTDGCWNHGAYNEVSPTPVEVAELAPIVEGLREIANPDRPLEIGGDAWQLRAKASSLLASLDPPAGKEG